MAGPEDNQPLHDSPFVVQRTGMRDLPWAILYGVFMALTLAGGVYGAVHRQGDAVQSTALRQPDLCPIERNNTLLTEQRAATQDFSISDFMKHAAVWLLVSAAFSLVLGLVFLWLFKWQAQTMTRLTIQLQIILPAAAGVSALIAGQIGAGVMMILMSLLAAAVFWLWRNEIDLCARLLTVAAHGLQENTGLLGFVVAAKVAMVGVVLPLGVLLTLSYTNGDLAPNPERDFSKHTICVDEQGKTVPCCTWQLDSWVPPFMSVASTTLLWTIFLTFELRVFVISGTIAQWYFAPPGLASTKGSTMLSIRHAFANHFGSLCLGSAILTVVQMARQAAEQSRQQQGGQNILMYCVYCCLECVYSLIEYLTKFATVCMAITGETFFTAARHATDLLTRNFLKAYGVWWFPPMVVQCAAFLLSVAWGLVTFLTAWLVWRHQSGNSGQQASHCLPALEAALLGFLSFLMSMVVLSFFARVLLDIVDAVFFCYAIDKDSHTVTREEVHEVFSQVPVGVAVENPDGGMVYGAPGSPARATTYVPPGSPNAMTGHIQGRSQA
eukprot:jgi/Astpho2/2800/e_gw1.00050.66.1_t